MFSKFFPTPSVFILLRGNESKLLDMTVDPLCSPTVRSPVVRDIRKILRKQEESRKKGALMRSSAD